jgi:hypothetical protein
MIDITPSVLRNKTKYEVRHWAGSGNGTAQLAEKAKCD